MANDLSGTLLISDLDGTLLTGEKRILPLDLAAIERFRALGGAFTVATGRAYTSAKPYVDQLRLTHPAVLYNGAVVYDYAEDRVLWRSTLPPGAPDYVRAIMEACPEAGVEVLFENEVYVLNMSEAEREHIAVEGTSYIEAALEEVPPGWLKVLFAMDESYMPHFGAFVRSQAFPGVSFVDSSETFYEMLPLNINKGTALREMLRVLERPYARIVAIGDYNNDVGLLETADLAVAPRNAIDSVKAVADRVVCTCEEGAIAEVIDYLINSSVTLK